jgi:hypothetical protein
MRRFGLFVACAAAGLMALPGPAAAQSGKSSVQELTLTEMTELIKESRGKSILLVFVYNSRSGQDVFAEVNKIAKEYRGRGLQVLAFSTDSDVKELEDLLAETKVNFDAYRVQGGNSAVARKPIQAVGLTRFNGKLPYAAVLDKDGKVAEEWPGSDTFNVDEYRDWLEKHLPKAKPAPGDAAQQSAPQANEKQVTADKPEGKKTPGWVPMLIGLAVAGATLVVGFGVLRK